MISSRQDAVWFEAGGIWAACARIALGASGPNKKISSQDAGLFGIRSLSDGPFQILWEGFWRLGGTLLNRITSDSKTNFGERADRAIEIARQMSPGLARNDAMKKAGILRLMADLEREIATKKSPIRGKKPHRAKQKDRTALQGYSFPDEAGDVSG